MKFVFPTQKPTKWKKITLQKVEKAIFSLIMLIFFLFPHSLHLLFTSNDRDMSEQLRYAWTTFRKCCVFFFLLLFFFHSFHSSSSSSHFKYIKPNSVFYSFRWWHDKVKPDKNWLLICVYHIWFVEREFRYTELSRSWFSWMHIAVVAWIDEHN